MDERRVIEVIFITRTHIEGAGSSENAAMATVKWLTQLLQFTVRVRLREGDNGSSRSEALYSVHANSAIDYSPSVLFAQGGPLSAAR